MAISTTAAKFRKTGDTLDYTAVANIKQGQLVVVDGFVCMAMYPIANGSTGTIKVLHRGEVIEVITNDAIGSTDAGTAIYVTSAGLVSKTESGNTLLGHARAAIGSTDLSFEVVCS